MSYKVAVVGATGNVGREILSILAERNFPVSEVVALASQRSVGKEVSFGETDILKVQDLEEYNFVGTDIALFSPGSAISKIQAPRAAEEGCVVIDNTSQFRMDPEVPLIVPEVNAGAIASYQKSGIIANPNCSTIQMVVALKPLHDIVPIKRVVVSTYQSVSGGGKAAMDELYRQTKSIYTNDILPPENFPKQIAFNVIPQIDVFLENGSTKEEEKMVRETVKIMGADVPVTATCVRVPVFVGHAESVNIEFDGPISLEEAHAALSQAPGIASVNGGDDFYATPLDSVREDGVYISRLRQDTSVDHGLNMWVVADNLRKGAALNAVQIAEILASDYL